MNTNRPDLHAIDALRANNIYLSTPVMLFYKYKAEILFMRFYYYGI